MDLNQRMEQFSVAYIRAVCAVAGYTLYRPEVDDDSVDWGIAARGGGGTIRSPRLELQLKCTAGTVLGELDFGFRLGIKNYHDLIPLNLAVPRILVVVRVPEGLESWLVHTEEQLLIRHCGYWLSLRGLIETHNAETVTVHVPRSQQFTPQALQSVMERVGQGGVP